MASIAKFGELNLSEPPRHGAKSVQRYEKLQEIGEGTYGKVYKAKDKETGEIVALKRIKMEGETEGFPTTAMREIKILKELKHDNIIKLKEVVIGPDEEEQKKVNNLYEGGIYMVLEYMDHDLAGLASRPDVKLSAPQIKCYMKQLLNALHYCHLNRILHRDIKASNLLIDDNGILKLGDFGLARVRSDCFTGNLTNHVITLPYRAPEVLLGSTSYTSKVDMWSVGCVFGEILHGEIIIPGQGEIDQIDKIFDLCGWPDESNWPGVSSLPLYNKLKPKIARNRRLREVFKNFDKHALDLLDRFLTLDPEKRISAMDALDAEYFWKDPLPCEPKSLPKYGSSHEYWMKKRRQQREQEKQQLMLELFGSLSPTGQTDQHSRMGVDQAVRASQRSITTNPGQHYRPNVTQGAASQDATSSGHGIDYPIHPPG